MGILLFCSKADGGLGYHGDFVRGYHGISWLWCTSWKAVGLTVTRSKGYCILCPINNWVMSFQPGFSQDHVPACKVGNLKCKGF